MSTVIAMKDLRLRLAEIADLVEQGTTFTVIRRSKPSFFMAPIAQKPKKKTYTIDDLIGAVSVENLAQNIDEELYG